MAAARGSVRERAGLALSTGALTVMMLTGVMDLAREPSSREGGANMAQTRGDAKVGGWFAASYSCVSMDRALSDKFPSGRALCPHAHTCPGCPLLDLSYSEQLAHKFESVRGELALYPELTGLTLRASQPAPRTLAYRTRAKLVAQGSALGLYAPGTHGVLDIPSCRVLDPKVARVVAALRALLGEQPILAGVDVARVGERLLVTLIAREESTESALAELAAQLCARCPEVAGVASTRRAQDAVQLLASGHVRISGEDEARATLASDGPYHYVAFGAFVQAHEDVARDIYEMLAARVFEASSWPRVLELYAGAGALSLALAARGAEVVAVESYGPACERLARAAAEQALSVRTLHGDAGAQLAQLRAEGAAFDVVLVNPPRRGLAPEVRERVAALSPQVIGYVSCRPSTLARDLAHFAELGFRCESAQPFDMMPMTEQVETLALLQPGCVPALRVRAEHAGTLVLEKPPFIAIEALAARVERELHRPPLKVRVSLSKEASGLVAFTLAEAAAQPVPEETHTFIVLAKGVLRARGKLRGAGGAQVRYQRERVISGHSLLRVHAPDEPSLRRALRAIRHPVLGDGRSDRESAKYFFARHGLDRPFLHLIELADLPGVSCPLPPDLGAVLRSLAARAQAADALAGA